MCSPLFFLAVVMLAKLTIALAFNPVASQQAIHQTSTWPHLQPLSPLSRKRGVVLFGKTEDKDQTEPSAFDKVASMGLAGILAITAAEAIFWALGVPLAEVYYKVTTGEWIDLSTSDGQIKAAGFSFGYGGFATVILQYRVTLFAIPLVPIMQKYVVEPGKKIWGERFGEKEE